jgi:hypothetical protein
MGAIIVFLSLQCQYLIDITGLDCYIHKIPGAVAQLGERLNGIQEAGSSILLSSTIESQVGGGHDGHPLLTERLVPAT